MMERKFTVRMRPGGRGYYVVECLELPGCISQGKTKASALKNIREAIGLYLESLAEHKIHKPRVEFIDVRVHA